jgi:hypothetical protein
LKNSCNLEIKTANVNYQTSPSKFTPIQLALSPPRANCFVTLLHSGANPISGSPKCKSNRLLAFATSNKTIIREFINATGASKDGGLHEAAREANVYAVKIQLKEFDKRDYPCTKFQGRTALAELCLNASNSPPDQVKKAILLLKDHGDFRCKSDGKSVLHFALDNQNAVEMTGILLDAFMSEHINDEFNIYEDETLRYSPLGYVLKGRNRAPSSQRPGLEALLKQFNCKNRFWAAEGDQPEHVIGAPPEIADHMRQLSWRREMGNEELKQIQARHNLEMKTQREQADLAAELEEKAVRRQEVNTQRKYDSEIAHTHKMGGVIREQRSKENRLEIAHKKSVALIDQGQIDAKYNAERRMRREELDFLQKREDIQTTGFNSRAQTSMKYLERQKELLKISNQGRLAIESAPSPRLEDDLY